MHVLAHVCPVPWEARGRHQIPWNWNHRWLQAAVWVLGPGPGASAGAASTLSPTPLPAFLMQSSELSLVLMLGATLCLSLFLCVSVCLSSFSRIDSTRILP